MLLQNFDFFLAGPSYELQIQQTLKVKPKNMFLHATPRLGLDLIAIEKKLLADTTSSETTGTHDAKGLTSRKDKSHKPMAMFFGGNMGTCESLNQTVSNAASSHGYKAQVSPLNDATKKLAGVPYAVFGCENRKYYLVI